LGIVRRRAGSGGGFGGLWASVMAQFPPVDMGVEGVGEYGPGAGKGQWGVWAQGGLRRLGRGRRGREAQGFILYLIRAGLLPVRFILYLIQAGLLPVRFILYLIQAGLLPVRFRRPIGRAEGRWPEEGGKRLTGRSRP
jgi:hypothetical protein